jgi:tetratricopeptide (TPR) repeat protein
MRHVVRTIRVAFAAVALTGLSACATGSITFQSTPPGAEILVKPVGAEDYRSIGETPLTLKSDELRARSGATGPIFVEYRKDLHRPARALVTDATGADLQISLELAQASGGEEIERINSVVEAMFECQSLARSGRHEEALAKLRALEATAPRLAAVYELQGEIYYLQKKYTEALGAYNLAVRFNPKSLESLHMRDFIEQTLRGARAPAGAPRGKGGAR